MADQKSSNGASKVRATIRVRPFNPGDHPQQQCVFVQRADRGSVELVDPRIKNSACQVFKFDAAYDVESTQAEIFDTEVAPKLHKLFQGINTTVFCYGNTGAGKTHTMQGTAKDPGIIPKAMERILHLAQECRAMEKAWAAVKTSYFEIYNEKVTDLIEMKEDLKVCEDHNKKTAILGLSETPVKNFDEFKRLYEDRSKNRTTAATNLNVRSSRSHAVLRISVEVIRNDKKYHGRLHLVDLAGSEDNRKTGNTGQRMVESSNINLSLFTLQRVVNALNEGQSVIPYRDSKLTRILKDSLGGSSCGVIIANIAPGANYFAHTQQTLSFASKSRQISNTPTVNVWEDELTKARREAASIAAAMGVTMGAAAVTAVGGSLPALTARMPTAEESAALEGRLAKLKSDLEKKQLTMDVETQKRIDKLEQLLLAQKKPAGPVPATPHTKTLQYRDRLREAKSFEDDMKYAEALEAYTKLYEDMSNDEEFRNKETVERMAKKIEKIRRRINDAAAAAVDKENLPPARLDFSNVSTHDNDASPLGSKSVNNVNLKKRKSSTESPVSEEDTEWGIPKPAAAKKKKTLSGSEKHRMRLSIRAEFEEFKASAKRDPTSVSMKLLDKLNSGTVKEISTELQHIGKKRAEMIVVYREANGPLQSIEDLIEVGLGEALVKSFARRNIFDICVYKSPADAAGALTQASGVDWSPHL